MDRPQELIAHFGMKPLPIEGTYFINTYSSMEKTAEGGPVGTVGVGLYLSKPRSASTFHVLTFDETWHFYEGDPIRLIELHPDGAVKEIILGRNLAAGQLLQHTVKAGVIQAGEVAPGGEWSFFACSMSPGFIGTCFRGIKASEIRGKYQVSESDIERFAVPENHEVKLPHGYFN